MVKLGNAGPSSGDAPSISRGTNENFSLSARWRPQESLFLAMAEFFGSGLSAEELSVHCERFLPGFRFQNSVHEAISASSWDRKFIQFMADSLESIEPETSAKLKMFRKALKARDSLRRHGDRSAREYLSVDGVWRDPDFSKYLTENMSDDFNFGKLLFMSDSELEAYWNTAEGKADKQQAIRFRDKKLKKVREIKRMANI